ncbi:MAG: hypothetical protein KME09_18115 [Pleurocapsa minor HA4230-MV1]|nr:hypothetical protein [Pleurocapsa minor HA4230-MV1]
MENFAWVQHSSGLLSGYVRVTATFEAEKQEDLQLPNQKIKIENLPNFSDCVNI